MNKKTIHMLEIIWLIMGILTLVAGIHQTITTGFENSKFMFIFSIIAFGMFFYRRKLRKSK